MKEFLLDALVKMLLVALIVALTMLLPHLQAQHLTPADWSSIGYAVAAGCATFLVQLLTALRGSKTSGRFIEDKGVVVSLK